MGFLTACPGGDDGGGSTSAPTSTTPTTTTPTPTTTPPTTTPTTTAPTTTTPTSGVQFQSIFIESAANVASAAIPGGCDLQVRVRNTVNRTVSMNLIYNAFDSAGSGIALTSVFALLPVNSTQTVTGTWATNDPSVVIPCSRIASFRLDTAVSGAL